MSFVFPSLASAFLGAIVLTWLVRKVAHRFGIFDCPDGVRKLHRSPIPLLGGVAVFGAWILGSWVGSIFNPESIAGSALSAAPKASLSIMGGFGPSLLLAAGVVLVMGVLDDVFGLRPRWKLLGQTIAASILVGGEFAIQSLWGFGFNLDIGWLGIVLSVVWLVGSMNSINMLDGSDGLVSTLGLSISATLTGMAWLNGDAPLGLLALALAGSLAGFLVFNFPPAAIFLGDSGSMLIGLLIGAAAIRVSYVGPATVSVATPLALLCLPISDGVEVVIRRRLNGRAIFAPDRGHIHHSLQRFGWSNRQILVGIGALSAATGSALVLSLHLGNESIALAAALAVAVGCPVTKWLANRESKERVETLGLPLPLETEARERIAA